LELKYLEGLKEHKPAFDATPVAAIASLGPILAATKDRLLRGFRGNGSLLLFDRDGVT
jgi:hypothetical protein